MLCLFFELFVCLFVCLFAGLFVLYVFFFVALNVKHIISLLR